MKYVLIKMDIIILDGVMYKVMGIMCDNVVMIGGYFVFGVDCIDVFFSMYFGMYSNEYGDMFILVDIGEIIMFVINDGFVKWVLWDDDIFFVIIEGDLFNFVCV